MLFNSIYEIIKTTYELNSETYRLLIFRYVFLIAFGCFIFIYQGKIKPLYLFASFAIGISYLIIVCYTGYKTRIITYWTSTSFLSAFYIIPIFYVLVDRFASKGFKTLEFIGKASYNIFLTQMVYYYEIAPLIYKNIPSRKIQLLFNICFCLAVGILFYAAETKITKYIILKTEPLVLKAKARIEQLL